MSSFEKKEQNLNQLIDKLNSLSVSYSQPNYELEKIRTDYTDLLENINSSGKLEDDTKKKLVEVIETLKKGNK